MDAQHKGLEMIKKVKRCDETKSERIDWKEATTYIYVYIPIESVSSIKRQQARGNNGGKSQRSLSANCEFSWWTFIRFFIFQAKRATTAMDIVVFSQRARQTSPRHARFVKPVTVRYLLRLLTLRWLLDCTRSRSLSFVYFVFFVLSNSYSLVPRYYYTWTFVTSTFFQLSILPGKIICNTKRRVWCAYCVHGSG